MGAEKKDRSPQKQDKSSNETEVLFQRMFGKWYAFSVIEEECLIGEIPEDEINKIVNKKQARG